MTTATQQRRPKFYIDETLARNLGANVYRHRMMILPYMSVENFAELARKQGQKIGVKVSKETIRGIQHSRDPSKPAHFPGLKTVEVVAATFRILGVDVTASDLFATPSKPTGQPRHLWAVPRSGEALPVRG